MSGSRGKMSPGDPLTDFRAADFNDFRDAAEWFKEHFIQATRSDRRQHFKQSGLVKIHNKGTENRKQFEVMAITDSLFDPSTDEDEFKRNPVSVEGRRPHCEDVGKFVICIEPIAKDGDPGDVGLAVISGVVQVEIEIEDSSHEYADITGGDATKLTSVEDGAAQILWRKPGLGKKWAIVRISNSLEAISCVSTSTTTTPTTPTTPTGGTGGTGTGTGGTGTGGTGTGGTGTGTGTGTGGTGTGTGTGGTGTGGTGTGTTGTTAPPCPPFICEGDCDVSLEVVTDVECVDGSIIVTKCTICLKSSQVDCS